MLLIWVASGSVRFAPHAQYWPRCYKNTAASWTTRHYVPSWRKPKAESRPLTVDTLSDPLSPEPRTPNHLLTLKTQIVLSPPGKFEPPEVYTRIRWRRMQYFANQFSLRWQEYRAVLQNRQKWTHQNRNMQEGDVLAIENEAPRYQWPMTLVTKTYPSNDNLVHKVQITMCKDGQRECFDRPVDKLVLALAKEDHWEPLSNGVKRMNIIELFLFFGFR